MRTRHFSPSDAYYVLMQSSCPTPVGTPLRAMLQGGQLQVSVPSTNISPQTVFGSLDPKSLAALQAAFHDSFAGEGQESKVRCACCLTHALYLMGILDRRIWCIALPGSLAGAGFSSAILCWHFFSSHVQSCPVPLSRIQHMCLHAAYSRIHFDVMVVRRCVLRRSLPAVTARLCLL